jgi:membrane protein
MNWMQPRTLLEFVKFVYQRFLLHDGLEYSKSLTFTSLFAVVPFITLVVSILAAFPSFQVFGAQIQDMLFQRLLPSSTSQLQDYLATFSLQARNLTWIGAVMLLVTAYLMLRNIERSFNQIWGVGELRKGLASFLLYWSVLSMGPLLLGLGFAISSYVTSLTLFERFAAISDGLGTSRAVLAFFPVLLTTGAFTLLYAAVPNCNVQVRHALAGAVVVALSFKLVKWVFAKFIATASYELVYGTFAALPIFLMWLYVCWVLILFGANLVRCIPLFASRTATDHVHPTLMLLALLHRFWQKQQEGSALRVQELIDQNWPFRRMTLEQLLALLEAQKLVRSLNQEEYMLVRDLDKVSVWEVLSALPWAQPEPADLDEPLPLVIASHLPDLNALKAHFLRLAESSSTEFGTSFGRWFRNESGWLAKGDKRIGLV